MCPSLLFRLQYHTDRFARCVFCCSSAILRFLTSRAGLYAPSRASSMQETGEDPRADKRPRASDLGFVSFSLCCVRFELRFRLYFL